jgi:hypothetical protein
VPVSIHIMHFSTYRHSQDYLSVKILQVGSVKILKVKDLEVVLCVLSYIACANIE